MSSWMSCFKPSSRKAPVLLVLAVVLGFSLPAASVSDSDMCFVQPVDQCQGNQFVELGNTDADTDGNPYTFEGSIGNAGPGEAVLQYKDSGSTSFSDIHTSTFYDDFGSSNSVFWQESQSFTNNEGSSSTVTINGQEQTIESLTIDVGSEEAETILNGNDLGFLSAGDPFTVEGQVVQLSELKTGQVEDQSQQINDGEWYNFTTAGTQHNVYVDSVIDSNTIFGEIDGATDNYNEGYSESLGDGYTLELTEVAYSGGSSGSVTWTVYQDVDQATYTVFDDVVAPEDHNEYRIKWLENGNPQAWSDSLFFSVDLGTNIPADKQVSINGRNVDQPRTLTNITQDSNINLTVFQGQEQDPMNVTLLTGSGTEVATISTGDDYGAFRAIFDDVGDLVLSPFRGGSNSTFVFPTLDSSLLSQQSTEYQFYFEIMDKAEAGNPVRTTKMYTVETGSTTNQPPNVTSFEAQVAGTGNWKPIDQFEFGEEIIDIRANIEDPDNEYLSAKLYLQEEYDGDVYFDNASYDENIGDTYSWDVNGTIPVDDSGNWTAVVYADDGAGNNVSEERNWTYSFGQPNITSSYSQKEVERYEEFNASLNVSCPQYECVNENESMNIYLDPISQEVVVKVGERNYRYDYKDLFSKSEPTVFSLEYWSSWIEKVFQ